MRTAHSLGVALALGLASAPAGLAEDRGPACRVEVSTWPSEVVTGEQVLYRARILRRADVKSIEWNRPLAFPNVRAEWLPGRVEDTRIQRDGASYLVREEHRALFPARPGRLTLPEFQLRCDLPTGRSEIVPAPAVSIEVAALPAHGRPGNFAGVVGVIHAQLHAKPEKIQLGESLRVSLLVRGAANLWVLTDPFPEDAFEGAEIFRRPPRLETESGERLYVRRFFDLDVVPHREGLLRIPAIELSYYDSQAGRYAVTRTEPMEVRVGPRRLDSAVPPSASGAAVPSSAEPDLGTSRPGSLPFALTFTLTLLVAAAGLGGWGLRAHRRRRWQRTEDCLATARVAADRRDRPAEAAALARALNAAVEAAGRSTVARADPSLREQLRELERIRFSEAAEPADRATVETLIAALRTRIT